jgi:hypothetical protein
MSAEVIELWAKKPVRKCSFCGSSEKQCARLVSNGMEGREERSICDRCLFEAKLRIRDLTQEVKPQ